MSAYETEPRKGSRRRSEGQHCHATLMDEVEEQVETSGLGFVGRGIDRQTFKVSMAEKASLEVPQETECSAEVEMKML